MSCVKENSIYPSSGEGRTFTTDTRDSAKQATSDRLGKPGPENGPEPGGGEPSSGGGEKHCTDEQGMPRRLCELLLAVVVAGFRWRDYGREGGPSAVAQYVGELVASLDVLQGEVGPPWNLWASERLATTFGEALGQAEAARGLVVQLGERTAERDLERRRLIRTEEQLEELREHLTRAHSEADVLREQLEQEKASSGDWKYQALEWMKSCNLARNERDELARKVDALELARDTREELYGRVDALTSERDALSEQLEELRARADIFEQGSQSEEELSTELTRQLHDARAELDAQRSSRARESQRNVELIRQRNHMRNEYLSNLAERGRFASDLTATLEEYEERAVFLERTREEHELLQNRYADLERACAALREELAEAQNVRERLGCVKEDLYAKIGDLCPGCVTELIEVGREALAAWERVNATDQFSASDWWEKTVDLRAQCALADSNEANPSCAHPCGGAS